MNQGHWTFRYHIRRGTAIGPYKWVGTVRLGGNRILRPVYARSRWGIHRKCKKAAKQWLKETHV